jgi:hypothetical protein
MTLLTFKTVQLHSEFHTQLKSNHGPETDFRRMIGENWEVWS